jgi:hypothetical protein
MRRALLPLAAILAASLLAACETVAPPPLSAPPPPPPPPPTPAEEFQWSTGRGANSLVATIAYRPSAAETWSCAGQAVALMPETSYSRGRMQTLYGSAERALQTVAQVRARSAANPGPDYSQFVRSTNCDAQDNFTFAGLPDGPYFIIARVRQTRPANAGGDMVIMQRVDLRGGGPTRVTLPQGGQAPGPARPSPARPAPRR